MRKVPTQILLAVFTLACLVTAVFAHEIVILKSLPADKEVLAQSPTEVMIWFSEELISGDSGLMVVNSQGVQIDNGDGGVDLNDPDHASMGVTLPPLADGSYTVQWQATLLDGDGSSGSYAFAVGAAEPALFVPEADGDSSDQPARKIEMYFIWAIGFLAISSMLLRFRRSSRSNKT